MKGGVKEKCFERLREYMSNASTRRGAYARVAEEFRVSVSAIKMAASRAGITSRSHSLRYSFSVEEEQDIKTFCIKHARRGTPLSVPELMELLSRYKKISGKGGISRKFVTGFIERHKRFLCLKTGKLTSPTRSSDVMLQLTNNFIDELGPLFLSKTINERNLFVFDETIIGESDVQQLMVGERRKSGGGNVNVFNKRTKALGCFIPFSMCDGTTPFKVFITRTGKSRKGARPKTATEEDVKVIRTPTEYRLLLSSETGYMTIPLYKSIMKHFTDWWTEDNPGLQCFLICDNLPVHVNKDVFELASANGVNIKTIMPGTSHWFQVHDQTPFGSLKKKIERIKKSVFASFLA